MEEETQDLSKNQSELNQKLRATREERAQELNYIRDINAEVRKQLAQLKHQNEFRAEVRTILKQTNDIAVQSYNLAEEEINLQESSDDIQKRILDTEKNITDSQREQETINKKIEVLRLEGTEESNNLADTLERVSESLKDIESNSEKFKESLAEAKKVAEEIESDTGVKFFSGVQDLVKSIPLLRNFSGPFDEAAKKTREIAANNKKIQKVKELTTGPNAISKKDALEKVGLDEETFDIGELSPSLEGVKTLGKKAGKLLAAGILKEFGEAIFRVDGEIVELQRSLGLTREEAKGLRQEMTDVANTSEDINITSTKLLETFSALNKQFGFINKFSAETLETTTQLRNVIGVSEESAGNLAALAELRGENENSTLETLLDTSRKLQEQKGIQLDTKEVLEAVGSVTGEIRANLGANPKAIAEALTLAKQFGGELSDIAASADSLLQFESSIAAELAAENILGREINLNRAREAALMGDMATLAVELTNELGDYNDFLNANVIERRKLAAAAGMEVNQLEKILFNQAIQNGQVEELAALHGADLLQRAQTQKAQDKLNASVDKLKDSFSGIAIALSPALDVLSGMLDRVADIMKFLEPIMGLLTGAAAGAAAGSIIPGVGTLAGAIGGGILGGLSDVDRMEDGIIDPSGNVVKTPKGSIELDKDDSIIAGTNLFGETKIPQPKADRIIPPSEMESQSDFKTVMQGVNMPTPEINTAQNTSNFNDYSQKSIQENKKQIEVLTALRKDIKENTKAVLASGNMVAKTRTKLTVGASDFGTDLNVFSSEIQ